jgi:hypothetical protein
MQLTAICSQYLKSDGMGTLVRVLLTVKSAPSSQDEHILCNLLASRGALKPGRTYRVTIEEMP